MAKKSIQRGNIDAADWRKILRDAYGDMGVFETWLMFLRTQSTDEPLPGEPGFNHGVHMAGVRDAIEKQRNRLLSMVEEKLGGKITRAQLDDCERMFEAAIEFVAHRNHWVHEAYRYESAVTKQIATRQRGPLQLIVNNEKTEPPRLG